MGDGLLSCISVLQAGSVHSVEGTSMSARGELGGSEAEMQPDWLNGTASQSPANAGNRQLSLGPEGALNTSVLLKLAQSPRLCTSCDELFFAAVVYCTLVFEKAGGHQLRCSPRPIVGASFSASIVWRSAWYMARKDG